MQIKIIFHVIFMITFCKPSIAEEEQEPKTIKYWSLESLDNFSNEDLGKVEILIIFDMERKAKELIILQKLINLRCLYVGGRAEGIIVENEFLSIIPKFKKLETLGLWLNEDDIKKLKFLSQLNKLKNLYIYNTILNNFIFDDDFFSYVKDLPLENMELRGIWKNKNIPDRISKKMGMKYNGMYNFKKKSNRKSK